MLSSCGRFIPRNCTYFIFYVLFDMIRNVFVNSHAQCAHQAYDLYTQRSRPLILFLYLRSSFELELINKNIKITIKFWELLYFKPHLFWTRPNHLISMCSLSCVCYLIKSNSLGDRKKGMTNIQGNLRSFQCCTKKNWKYLMHFQSFNHRISDKP